MRLKAHIGIDAGNELGEGPAWDAKRTGLIWSDNAKGIIHEAHADGRGGWRENRRWTLDRRIGAATPRAAGGFAVVAGIDILMVDEAGGITPFARLDIDPALVRFNDAKCDPQGRLWAGTVALDYTTPCGALYRIDANGHVTTAFEGVILSNGLDWSPDGRTLYFIDSSKRAIDAFDFDGADGTIRNRRTMITIEPGSGLPDGMTVDREGCLWVAVTGAGEIRRYGPDGRQRGCIDVSAPFPTSCAFGGDDGADLFITSIGTALPPAALHVLAQFGLSTDASKVHHPEAGALFVCRPGPTGRPATPFAG